MTAQPVINRLVDLYDVDTAALADGTAFVRQGAEFVAVPVMSRAEVEAFGLVSTVDGGSPASTFTDPTFDGGAP